MATIGDAITAALQDLGVIQAGETPSAEDSALALSRINEWIDGLANEGLTLYSVTRTTWTMVSGTSSYAIATGGTVNIARPVSPNAILNIGYIDTSQDPDLEINLGPILTEDAYALLPQKALTAVYPSFWYYRPTYPSGALLPWPVPTSSTLEGVIYTQAQLSEFSGLTDSLALPPGYKRFVRTNLTLEMAGAFDAQPSPALIQAAIESKATLKRTNTRLLDLSVDRGALVQARGPIYDIYAGP